MSGGMDLMNIENQSENSTVMFVYIKKELPLITLDSATLKLSDLAKNILDKKGLVEFIRM
jgi:hypothetical protein